MKTRYCPVCNNHQSHTVMRFTPEQISKANPTYDRDKLKEALKDKDRFLTYSRCDACGMIFCKYIWDDDTLEQIYAITISHNKSREKIYAIDKRLALINTWNNILRLLKLRGKKQLNGVKIIDFGSGWGDFLDVAAGSGIQSMGYDQDKEKLAFSKKNGHQVAEDLEQLENFGPVDIFIMNSVLEHVQNVQDVFDFVHRVLKPDGILVFSVMDYRGKFIEKNSARVMKGQLALTKNFNPVEHVNIYNYQAVCSTLVANGFRLLSTRHVLYLTDFYGVKNSSNAIRILNWAEKALSHVLTGKDIGIQVYAARQ